MAFLFSSALNSFMEQAAAAARRGGVLCIKDCRQCALAGRAPSDKISSELRRQHMDLLRVSLIYIYL